MEPDILAQLQSAKEEHSKDWLVMERSLSKLDSMTQRAVWAAAIPHWFDEEFLAALLNTSPESVNLTYNRLIQLSFVESFPDFGYNIHDRSRKILLDHLYKNDHPYFIELSHRASEYCLQQDQHQPEWRIEFIYHALTSGHKEVERLLTNQVNTWRDRHLDDKVEMLTRAALEAAEENRVPEEIKNKIELLGIQLDLVYGRKELKKPDDLQIVTRFLTGDAAATQTINTWASRAAWPYQRRLADRWDDVLQEVRLEVTRLLAQGKFKGESSLRTYIWRVVAHTCLDQIRSRSKWEWTDLNALEDPNSAVRRYVNQETEDFTADEKDLLSRVLDKVPQDCREIWRAIIAGLTYREMSTKFNVPEGTLRVRMLRCRERAIALRSELLGREGTSKLKIYPGAEGKDTKAH